MISKAKLKYLSSLKLKKNRDQENKFLIEGLRLCEEALDSEYTLEEVVYCAAAGLQSQRGRKLLETIRRRNIPITEISTADLKRLADTVHSQGILGVVRKRFFDFDQTLNKTPRLLIALDEINDPGNLGAIIRTASWFGAGALLLSENSVEAFNSKVVRASMGGLFHLAIFENCNLEEKIAALKKTGCAVWAADADGDMEYWRADFSGSQVLILGNEISGVNEKVKRFANAMLKIPRRGKGESLNVAVAAGILLAEMSRSQS